MIRNFFIASFGLGLMTSVSASDFDASLLSVLQHHPTLMGKKSEVQASEFRLESAKYQRLPSIAFSVNEMNDDYEQGVLTVTQPLYTFGNISANINKTKAQLAVDNADYLRVNRTLLEQTAQAYNNYFYAQKVIELGRLNVEEHEKLLEHIERRLEGKLASEADVNLVRSRLSGAQMQLKRYKREANATLNALYALTIEPVTVSAPVPVERWQSLLQTQNLTDELVKNDPQVVLKQYTIDVLEHDVKLSQTANLPTINLRAEHNFLDAPLQGDKNRIGVVIESNLDGLGLVGSGQTHAAKMTLAAAKSDLESTKVQLKREVDNLVEDVNLYSKMVEQQQNSVALVEQTFESYFRQYRTGRKSWLDVINIQRELTEQRVQLLELEKLSINALIGIASGMGALDSIRQGS